MDRTQATTTPNNSSASSRPSASPGDTRARLPNSELQQTRASLRSAHAAELWYVWADRAIPARVRSSQRTAFPESATLRPMTDAARLLEAALQLAPRERAELVEALTASLDGSDLGEAWESEIRQRIADVDAGRVEPLPGEQVFSRIEQRLRAR